MSNDNKLIQQKIKKEFLSLNDNRNIKIPSGIHLFLSGNNVKMKLSNTAVCSNMQQNDGAFDGWAMVLKRWGGFENVIISWDKPEVIESGHYQRFLFRVKHFSEDFESWFSIENLRSLWAVEDYIKLNQLFNASFFAQIYYIFCKAYIHFFIIIFNSLFTLSDEM